MSNNKNPMEASFSTLILSIASSAAMCLGLSPNPQTGKTELNKEMAKFNIDLLRLLKEKTKNNLDSGENELLTKMISDLQMQFVSLNR